MSASTSPHDYIGEHAPKPTVKVAPKPLYRAVRVLASLRLTVILFSLGMALVFFGTLGMTQDSIEGTVRKYFRSWFVMIDMQGFAEFAKVFLQADKDMKLPIKIPFLGGYTIGWLMFFNLAAAHAVRFKLSWKRIGIIMLHAGVVVLLAGEFLTGQLSVETHMRIREGETAEHVFSLTQTEFAVIDSSDPNVDSVVVVPGDRIENAKKDEWISHPDLPFDVQVFEYAPNADIRDYGPNEQPMADNGVGLRVGLKSIAKVKGTDSEGELNYPGAYFVLRAKNGESLGKYLFVTRLERRLQEVKVGDKTYNVVFRMKRTYKPYKVQLLKADHDVYAGTSTPKDFASTVTVNSPSGEYGPIRIWMNHPMYYQGETFYQSKMDTDSTGVKTTSLQVVNNPAWQAPYLACLMVALGMAIHFLIRLQAFMKRGGVR
jgi:ResB-like family